MVGVTGPGKEVAGGGPAFVVSLQAHVNDFLEFSRVELRDRCISIECIYQHTFLE